MSPLSGCRMTNADGTTPGISCCGMNSSEWWKIAFSRRLITTTGLYLPNLSTRKPATAREKEWESGSEWERVTLLYLQLQLQQLLWPGQSVALSAAALSNKFSRARGERGSQVDRVGEIREKLVLKSNWKFSLSLAKHLKLTLMTTPSYSTFSQDDNLGLVWLYKNHHEWSSSAFICSSLNCLNCKLFYYINWKLIHNVAQQFSTSMRQFIAEQQKKYMLKSQKKQYKKKQSICIYVYVQLSIYRQVEHTNKNKTNYFRYGCCCCCQVN